MYHSAPITIHKPEDFAAMREAGRLAAEVLDMLYPLVRAGTSTKELNQRAYEFILDHNAIPATLFYRGYRASLCASPNHIICHGIPDERPLQTGDILNIDVTVIVNGWHGDHSRMFAVGTPSAKAQNLMDVCYRAMMAGIAEVKPGKRLGDIGNAIQKEAHAHRCSVVREFCGHGIGRVFHQTPNVLHYGEAGTGEVLREGMFFTIEPMINAGKAGAKLLADGWTAVTRDRSLSAQYEHTIGVTATGYEVFTLSPQELHTPHTQPAG